MAPPGIEDLNAQRFFRAVLDDVAQGSGQPVSERQRLDALAALDGLPPDSRALVGRFLLQNTAVVAGLRSGVAEQQITTPPGNELVIVEVCSKINPDVLTRHGMVWRSARQLPPVRIERPITSLNPEGLSSGVSKSACASSQTTPIRPATDPGDRPQTADAVAGHHRREPVTRRPLSHGRGETTIELKQPRHLWKALIEGLEGTCR
jgi:hypothetical protein